MNPNIAGATISGIFMTMPLGFDVRCIYDDNFDLTIDDIYIDYDQVDMGDEDGAIEGDGDVSFSQNSLHFLELTLTPLLTTSRQKSKKFTIFGLLGQIAIFAGNYEIHNQDEYFDFCEISRNAS